MHSMAFQYLENLPIRVTGKFLKTVRLRDEPYVSVEEPRGFIQQLKQAKIAGDLFTFTQPIADTIPKHEYFQEAERLAVLQVSTYEHWLQRQSISGCVTRGGRPINVALN